MKKSSKTKEKKDSLEKSKSIIILFDKSDLEQLREIFKFYIKRVHPGGVSDAFLVWLAVYKFLRIIDNLDLK